MSPVLSVLVALALSPAVLAYDAFIQLSRGGTVIAGDNDLAWTPILGFERGSETTVQTTSGGFSTGNVEPTTASIQLESNALIPELLSGTAQGFEYDLKIVLARRGSISSHSSVLSEVIFDKVLFEKVSTAQSTGDDAVLFDLKFKYNKIIVTNTLLDQTGKVTSPSAAGWDFELNGQIIVAPAIPDLGDYFNEVVNPVANIDNDSDLMPNDWETFHSFNPESNADAGLDADKDGFTNLQEYIAGTHPRLSNSFFRVSTINTSASSTPQIELSWTAKAGRTYKVQSSNSPNSGFTVIHTRTPFVDSVETFQPTSGKFFRIIVED